MAKQKLIEMLNHALELEHAAHAQYLSYAEIVDGLCAEPIIARLKEIAGDEKAHQEKFRNLTGILGGVPSMGMAPTKPAKNIKQILANSLHDEKEAVDFYKQIYDAVRSEKGNKGYYFYILEHEIRHIIMDEQEHVTELELLQGTQGKSY